MLFLVIVKIRGVGKRRGKQQQTHTHTHTPSWLHAFVGTIQFGASPLPEDHGTMNRLNGMHVQACCQGVIDSIHTITDESVSQNGVRSTDQRCLSYSSLRQEQRCP
eukprot:m.97998 g.97998  ORF g.97998 m.97998 type:complete len:106 (-) comp13115_c0_seq4:873-1190(-)